MPKLIAWAVSIVFLAGPAPLLAADEGAQGPSDTGAAAQQENANKQSEEGATKGQERAAERRHVQDPEKQANEKQGKWAEKSEKSRKQWKKNKKAKKGEVGGKQPDEAAKEWKAKAKGPEPPATPDGLELPGAP